MRHENFLESMPKIRRLTGNSDWIDFDFVEYERTPEPAMKLGIQVFWFYCKYYTLLFYFMIWVSNVLAKASMVRYRSQYTTVKLKDSVSYCGHQNSDSIN